MILSTQTDYLGRKFGEERAIDIIADAGFDAVDLTLFSMKEATSVFCQDGYREYAEKLKAKAQSRGLFFNQAHAPFPCSKPDEEYNVMMYERLVRSIEIAGIVGVKCIVVHPMHHLPYLENAEKLKAMNMEFYRSLAPYAKAVGVKIALENMWQRNQETKQIVVSACSRTKEFVDWLDTLNDDCFTACLDLGHCGLYGFDAAEMIKGLGKRLGALHVHDNDYQGDQHTAPYLGRMHWDTICDALARIGYKGDLTLEADNFYNPFGEGLAADAAKFLCAIGRNLIERIDNAKAKPQGRVMCPQSSRQTKKQKQI